MELTTGPLGQGFANGIGLAIAEAHLAATYNRDGHTIVDHRTFGLVSDGDVMEGVAYEAASLAGHLRLGKLVYLYDANQVTLAGSTGLVFSEDVGKTLRGAGLARTARRGRQRPRRPRGGAAAGDRRDRAAIAGHRPHHHRLRQPAKAGTFAGARQPARARRGRGDQAQPRLAEHEPFVMPDEALQHFRRAVERGAELEADWQSRFDAYARPYPSLAAQFTRAHAGELPRRLGSRPARPSTAGGKIATRAAGETVINAVAGRSRSLSAAAPT